MSVSAQVEATVITTMTLNNEWKRKRKKKRKKKFPTQNELQLKSIRYMGEKNLMIKIFVIVTFIQHYSGDLSQCNKIRKEM